MPRDTDDRAEPLNEQGLPPKKEGSDTPERDAEGGGAFWRFVLPLSLLLIGASVGFVLTALGITNRLS